MDGTRSEELRLLEEIARWTREIALPVVRPRVIALLDTDAKKRVYDAMADGAQTVSALEKATGANHSDIRAWITAWEGEGIADDGASPPKASFTLRELGIESPPARTARARRGAK